MAFTYDTYEELKILINEFLHEAFPNSFDDNDQNSTSYFGITFPTFLFQFLLALLAFAWILYAQVKSRQRAKKIDILYYEVVEIMHIQTLILTELLNVAKEGEERTNQLWRLAEQILLISEKMECIHKRVKDAQKKYFFNIFNI